MSGEIQEKEGGQRRHACVQLLTKPRPFLILVGLTGIASKVFCGQNKITNAFLRKQIKMETLYVLKKLKKEQHQTEQKEESFSEDKREINKSENQKPNRF